MYKVTFTKGGEKDLKVIRKSPYREIAESILEEIALDPFSKRNGLEKIDDGEIFYARRISGKHRLVYQIDEDEGTVLVYQMWNHYDRMGQKQRKR